MYPNIFSVPSMERARIRGEMLDKRYEVDLIIPGLDETYPGYTNHCYVDEDQAREEMVWVTLETRDQILCDLLRAGEEVGDLPFTRPESDGLVYLGETEINPVTGRRAEVAS